ncbi:hypothetical protein AwErysi_04190 [Erysipelotrichaceae bacterium]|nr:hypothetical protein AwErysi_04190 [Erysipelotrichaceae bacterium]
MKIVAITSCPTGVAHTYMAATKLELAAKKLGYEIKVEKQGARGIEDKLTKVDIENADIVIFAVETNVQEMERFDGVDVYRCPVVAPIKNAEAVFEKALQSRGSKRENSKPSLKTHILTGVSYMIPIVIAASVIMGIARIGGMAFGITDIWDIAHKGNGLVGFFYTLDGLGGTALGLMLPVFAGFISYSIAGKQGLAAGFAGGMLAKNIESGFFGALAAGLIAGYITAYLAKNINFKGALASLGTVFLIPVGSVLITMLLIQYVVGVPFTWLNQWLITSLVGLDQGSAIIMALVVGAMVGFDLGGPVNKAAVVTAMGLLESGVYGPNTAAQVAIIIPALGYGVAAIIKGKNWSDSFKNAGSASFIMGLVGVSEGAIPFTLANPKILVPFNMIGCGVGAMIAVMFGAVNSIPISGIYGWFLVERWYVYVFAILVGTAIVATGAIISEKSFKKESEGNVI